MRSLGEWTDKAGRTYRACVQSYNNHMFVGGPRQMGFLLHADPTDHSNTPLEIDLFWNHVRALHLGLVVDDPDNQKHLDDLLDKFIEASRRAIFLQRVEGRGEVELSYDHRNLLGLYCTPEAEHDERVEPEFFIAEDSE